MRREGDNELFCPVARQGWPIVAFWRSQVKPTVLAKVKRLARLEAGR